MRSSPQWALLSALLGTRSAPEAHAQGGPSCASDSVADRLTPLVARHLRHLYDAGLYREVLFAASERNAVSADPAALRTTVTCALFRFVQTSLAAEPGLAASAMPLVEDLRSLAPRLIANEDFQLVRGLLFAAAGHARDAFEALDEACQAGMGQPEGLLQLARCALDTGEVTRSAEILRGLDQANARVARMAAVHSALAGDWEGALRHLEASAPPEYDSPQAAAIRFQAGRVAEVNRQADREPSCAYYAAVLAARDGDRELAERLCRAVPPGHALRAGAEQLTRWLQLQDARDCLSGGDRSAGTRKALEAAHRWQRECRLAARSDRHGALQERADMVGPPAFDVPGLQDLPAARAEEISVAHCHHLALFHMSEGERCAAEGDGSSAVGHFEEAIARFAVPLTDPDYLRDWTRRRRATYGVAMEADTASLVAGVVGVIHGALARWEAHLRQTDETNLADCLAALSVSFRAELRGAELVRGVGGGIGAAGCTRPVAVGPTCLALIGGERAFAAFLAESGGGGAESLDDSDEARWEMLVAGARSGGPPPIRIDRETRAAIERLYSELRFAAVLDAGGQLEEALASLRRVPRSCVPVRERRVCEAPPGEFCDERCTQFARCNPAFAWEGGGARLKAAARDLEVSLLLRLGEREVALSADRIDQGIAYWRDALESSGERRAQTFASIREVARGRAKVLNAHEREAEAIRLLEGADGLLQDPEIRGELALAYMQLGVRSANATSDWRLGVDYLRKARQLNPHSSRIDLNLAVGLCNWASEIAFDLEAADRLLTEASDIARSNLAIDPNSSAFQDVIVRVRRGREEIRLRGGSPARPSSGSSPARLSALFYAQGVEKAETGDLDGAIEALEQALDCDPSYEDAILKLKDVILLKVKAGARGNG